VCLWVASAGGAESIILLAGDAESMMLSACAESMDTISTGAESIILSAPPAESMILSALFGCIILTVAVMKKTAIGDTDDRQLRTLVNSASTAPPIGLPPKMPKFCHTLNILLVGRQRHCALLGLYFNSSVSCRSVGQLVGRSVGWLVGRSVSWSVSWSVGWSVGWPVGWPVGHWLVGWSKIRVPGLWEFPSKRIKESDNGLPCNRHYKFNSWKPVHLKCPIRFNHPTLLIKPIRHMGFHHLQPANTGTAH
jgi:hypothetical protein